MYAVAVAAALTVGLVACGPGPALAMTAPELRAETIRAPLDYRQPGRGAVNLRYAIAKAVDPGAAREPIFVLEALGESGVDAAAKGLLQSLSAARQTHDLIFVDQRGVGGDGLLDCPFADPAAGAFSAVRLASCSRRFPAELLRSLDAETFAHDIETLRRKLGYRRIMLVGYFYGARIATTYLGRWPEHVAAAALTDVSSPDVPAPLANAAAAEVAVRATIAACRQDVACHASYPELASDYDKVLRRYTGSHVNPGRSRGGEIDGLSVLGWLVAPTFRWGTAAGWPRTIHELAQGRMPDVVPAYLRFRREALASYPLVERLSVECAEDFARVPTTVLSGRTANAIAASGDGALAEVRACQAWQSHVYRGPRPRSGDTPVFAVSAAADIAGPPAAARRALSPWKRAQLVVLPDRARAADDDWDQCVGPMITAFLETPGQPVDTGCVTRLHRPEFRLAAEKEAGVIVR
jgi:pimeloyl-ACP methyl ester carboxylesterase